MSGFMPHDGEEYIRGLLDFDDSYDDSESRTIYVSAAEARNALKWLDALTAELAAAYTALADAHASEGFDDEAVEYRAKAAALTPLDAG